MKKPSSFDKDKKSDAYQNFGKPNFGKPAVSKSVVGKSAVSKSVVGKSVVGKSVVGKSAVGKSVVTKPVAQFAPKPHLNGAQRARGTPNDPTHNKMSKREGARPKERLPIILETTPTQDYALIDSGNGRKLEQYGPYRIERPEGQAIWLPALPPSEWAKADAVFTGNTEEEGMGRWIFPRRALDETWETRHDGMAFLGRFTSFRHVGVFPEQAAHWSFMETLIKDAKRPVKVLNLFGYTGVASLLAARAGAEVTHVDASKKAINWAKENQSLAGLDKKPIRWIVDDAMKFVLREARRGSTYDIILLDPPAYGRGPTGEVWQLFEHLPEMVDVCRTILSPNPLGLVLTAYSIRSSFYAIHELVRDRFTGMGGTVESGELILREQHTGRALSTSLFSRWVPQ